MNALSDRRRPPLFPRGPGVGVRALILALIAGGLLLTTSRSTPQLDTARNWASLALQPLRWAAGLPDQLFSPIRRLSERGDLQQRYDELQQSQLVMQAQLQRMAALEAENERLRGLLSSAAELQQRVLIAEILSVSQDPYRHQIMLNKGTRDGVYRGQALVDAYGVMGQVIEVNPTTSTALLITDPNHGIPVEINRTGLQTIALGRGDGSGLSLPYLPGNADVKVGDLIVSSGLGGRFPAGYPVGQIHELRHSNGDSFMEGIAFPAARLNQERQALLVWSQQPPVPTLEETPPKPAPAPKSASRR